MLIDITGLDRADLLATLWNICGPVERPAFRQAEEEIEWMDHGVAVEEARDNGSWAFEEVKEKPFPVDLSGECWFDPEKYDGLYGKGLAVQAVRLLRKFPFNIIQDIWSTYHDT